MAHLSKIAALLTLAACAAPPPAPTPKHILDPTLAAQKVVKVLNRFDQMFYSMGSGVPVRAWKAPDGLYTALVLTAWHVVEKPGEVDCRTFLYRAPDFQAASSSTNYKILAIQPERDLALLEIRSKDPIPTIEPAAPQPRVGERVLSAGFPFGLGLSISDGYVTTKAPVRGVAMWRCSAFSSPGGSGGAVLNAAGKLLGITLSGDNRANQIHYFISTAAPKVKSWLHKAIQARVSKDAADPKGTSPLVRQELRDAAPASHPARRRRGVR